MNNVTVPKTPAFKPGDLRPRDVRVGATAKHGDHIQLGAKKEMLRCVCERACARESCARSCKFD